MSSTEYMQRPSSTSVMIYEVKSNGLSQDNYASLISNDGGHFYWNVTHFKKLELGDIVFIANKTGKEVLYTELATKEIKANYEEASDRSSFNDLGHTFSVGGKWDAFVRLKVLERLKTHPDWHWTSLGSSQNTYLLGAHTNPTTAANNIVRTKELLSVPKMPESAVNLLNSCIEHLNSKSNVKDTDIQYQSTQEAAKELFSLLEIYRDNQTVFRSSERGQAYSIAAVDSERVIIQRLDANEQHAMTLSNAAAKLQLIKDSATQKFRDVSNTSAERNTILQSAELLLTSDKKQVIWPSDDKQAMSLISDYLVHALRKGGSSEEPKLYKPAMIYCVVKAIATGELKHNHIPFDWIAPKFIQQMKELGQEVTDQNAAQPFFYLTSDLIWLHSVTNFEDRMLNGSEGPSAARSKVKFASLAESLWRALQNKETCKKIMTDIENTWFDKSSSPRIWVEKCHVKGRKDREDGEHALGKALWSPQFGVDGRDIYSTMLKVNEGDVVLHLTDNKGITSASIVAGPRDESFIGLSGTSWADQPAYRIPLKDNKDLPSPLLRDALFKNKEVSDELLKINSIHSGLFYNKKLELNQGAYLTEAPSDLARLLNTLHKKMEGTPIPHFPDLPDYEFNSIPVPTSTYTWEDAESEIFHPIEDVKHVVELLKRKKNIILQGAPGVGKTYIAKRLAWLSMQEKDASRIEIVQFHQSYSYEDFVQGLRPDESGNFAVQDGLFYKFCKKAREDKEGRPHFMIIDEINRGNLSKIFGELLMLIEADKRGSEHALSMPYDPDGIRFWIPENIHFIGTMNTADRSLSLVDYALRRRFAFIDLPPAFDSPAFKAHLSMMGSTSDFVSGIVKRMESLNDLIASDPNLGNGFRIGHSFFTPFGVDPSDWSNWYDDVLRFDIEPLLREYWLDDLENIDKALQILNQ